VGEREFETLLPPGSAWGAEVLRAIFRGVERLTAYPA
jgi:hypothetical protein